MRGGTDWGWIYFGGEQERSGVRTELVPKGREKVQELEHFNGSAGLFKLCEKGSRNDEKNEVGEESDGLHSSATVEFVIDEQCRHVVANKRHSDVE